MAENSCGGSFDVWCEFPPKRFLDKTVMNVYSREAVAAVKTGFYMLVNYCIITKDSNQDVDILPENQNANRRIAREDT